MYYDLRRPIIFFIEERVYEYEEGEEENKDREEKSEEGELFKEFLPSIHQALFPSRI